MNDRKPPQAFDMLNRLTEELSAVLASNFDELFTEGLKRKGYAFTSKQQLHRFVVENCRSEYNPITNSSTYFVKDEPFFYFVHMCEIDTSNSSKVTATHGKYCFL